MTSKRASADDILRHFATLRRLQGVLFLDHKGLWLLRLNLPDVRPTELAYAITHVRFSSAEHAARVLHASEILPITAGRLSSWAYALKRIETQNDLQRWIKEGIRGIKNLRGQDIPAILAQARDRHDHISTWFLQTSTLSQYLEGSREPEVLSCAWEARHAILGAWPESVSSLLARRPVREAESRASAAALGWLTRHHASPPDMNASHRDVFFQARQASHAPQASWLAMCDVASELPFALWSAHEEVPLRLHLLYGEERSARMLRFVSAPYQRLAAERAAQKARADTWIQTLRHLDQGIVTSQTGALAQERESRQHTALARSFLRHVMTETTWLSERATANIARAHLADGWAAAGRAMFQRWQDALSQDTPISLSSNLLAIALAQPDVTLVAPDKPLSSAVARNWATNLWGQEPTRAQEIWSACQENLDFVSGGWSRERAVKRAMTSGHSAQTIAALFSMELWDVDLDLLSEPWQLERYVEVVRLLRDIFGDGEDLWTHDWFLRMFRERSGWIEPFLYTIATNSRDAGVQAQEIGARLMHLATALHLKNTPARDILQKWHTIPDALSPEHVAFGQDTSITQDDLREYLHHRDLLGHGRTLSAALVQEVAPPSSERECAWLRAQLEDAALEPQRREAFTRRLAKLQDPQATLERAREQRRRARTRFARALQQCRQDSLNQILDRLLRAALTRYIPNKHLPKRIDPRWLTLLGDIQDEDLKFEHIETLLRQSFMGEVSEPNQAFLARPHGRAWAQGMRATIMLGEDTFEVSTSDDVLESLHMGTYFDTCLALRGGVNAASAVTNVLDANKHVVYVRDARGVVVGRKLIGLTRDAQVLGYNTYSSRMSEDEAMRVGVDHVLCAWLESIGLSVTQVGAPENLHGAFWYDDTAWPWSASIKVETPEGWPDDTNAAAEWALMRAREEESQEAYEAVPRYGVEMFSSAAYAELWHIAPQPPRALPWWEERDLVMTELFATRPIHAPAWMRTLRTVTNEVADAHNLWSMLTHRLLRASEVRQGLKSLRAAARKDVETVQTMLMRHDSVDIWESADTKTQIAGLKWWQEVLLDKECDPPCEQCHARYHQAALTLAMTVLLEGSERVFAAELKRASGWWLELLLLSASKLQNPHVRRVLAARAHEPVFDANGLLAIAAHGLLKGSDPRLVALPKEDWRAGEIYNELEDPEGRLKLTTPWLDDVVKAPDWALQELGLQIPRRLVRAAHRQATALLTTGEGAKPVFHALLRADLGEEALTLSKTLAIPWQPGDVSVREPNIAYACVARVLQEGSLEAWRALCEVPAAHLSAWVFFLTNAAPDSLPTDVEEHICQACLLPSFPWISMRRLDMSLWWLARQESPSDALRQAILEQEKKNRTYCEENLNISALVRVLGDPTRAECAQFLLETHAQSKSEPDAVIDIANQVLIRSGADDAWERAMHVLDLWDWSDTWWVDLFDVIQRLDGPLSVQLLLEIVARMPVWNADVQDVNDIPARRRAWWLTVLGSTPS